LAIPLAHSLSNLNKNFNFLCSHQIQKKQLEFVLRQICCDRSHDPFLAHVTV
jgi:hypothetical protein